MTSDLAPYTQPVTQLGALMTRGLTARGLTQTELAKLMEVSQPTVSAWLNGSNSPHRSRLRRLAEVLEVPYQELLDAYHADADEEELLETVRLQQSQIEGIVAKIQQLEKRVENLSRRPPGR